jgi:hypothetical protein
VFSRLFHSTYLRRCVAACLLAAIAALPGCSLWHRTKESLKENLNLDKYRDERASDIDRRLSAPDSSVNNPF